MKKSLQFFTLMSFLIALPQGLFAAAGNVLSAEEKARFSENMLLPNPSEIFVALNKIGKTDWTNAASYSKKYDYKGNYLRALNLGVRAADGFLAIQARDKSRLGEMIVVIITLAEELMVEKTILDKSKKFEELSKRDQWDALHKELDILREDVVREINRLGDQDVALMVCAGGWLEGLRAATKVLNGQYEPVASSVLYQPKLCDYFSDRLKAIGPEAQKTPAVQKLMARLPEIKALVDVGYQQPISKENIAKLYTISTELIQLIERG